MKLLSPVEKDIYLDFMNIVEIRKIEIKPQKPPEGFEPNYVWDGKKVILK